MTDFKPDLLTPDFRSLSARLGSDPLQVQGPGGNTSVKDSAVMWIKASGTELAQAVSEDIFVAVDRQAAMAEARGEAGDGSCKTTGLDPNVTLRPSIETTFHAALNFAVVAHTHSVATIVHAISEEGRAAAAQKLADLNPVFVPYAKPGLPLTGEILAQAQSDTRVIILQNHGLICCGDTVGQVSDLIADVEARLALPVLAKPTPVPSDPAPEGFSWAAEGWLGADPRAYAMATAGTYYPDHVVFLGPALPSRDHDGAPPVILVEGQGVLIRDGATASQKAMLQCAFNVLSRMPADWTPQPISEVAEAELLNWDAEKYRQALAAR